MLPTDLRQAENQAVDALESALAANDRGRWQVELRFEGLRLLPVALRLAESLQRRGRRLRLLFADAGATALARRDSGEGGLSNCIASFSDQRLRQDTPVTPADAGADCPDPAAPEPLLLLVGAAPSDYEAVEGLCTSHAGAVVLLNPTLEDAAVGIGSVARARRKGFLAQWQTAYALRPFADSALRRAHPGDWELYRLDRDGFRLAARFPEKPTAEEQAAALGDASAGGLARQLSDLGDLLEDLRR